LNEEFQSGTEVDCGMAYGFRFSVRLKNGKFEVYARDLIMRKDRQGKIFDDVDRAIHYGWKWRENFERTKNIQPV